tara:strand:- start:10349 stop:10648 length:300 start_codon:yes stop_codon:yes gene_type:complete
MASVYLTFGTVGARANFGNASVYLGHGATSEVVTSSVASAQSTSTAGKTTIVQIFCATAVYVLSGNNPTATATNGIFCPGGVPVYIAPQSGEKIAVIDA